MHDLVRQLKQNAYHTADREKCDVEETPEWRAMIELEAWRSAMPQYEYRDGGLYRKPENLPPHERGPVMVLTLRCSHEFTYWAPSHHVEGKPVAWVRDCTKCQTRETSVVETDEIRSQT